MKHFKHYTCAVSVALLLFASAHGETKGRAIGDRHGITAGVLVGPIGSPTAQGPTSSNDDFTNRSLDGGAAVSTDGLTTFPGTTIFKNTLENTGPGDDAFIITAPSAPAGFRVEASTDFGDHYVTLDSTSYQLTLPVAYRASATLFVRITAPAGVRALTAYDSIIRATSTIDPAIANETIDRVYAGYVRLDLQVRVIGAGDPEVANATPGSEIEFTITYTNISSAQGSGNALLTAYNIVIKQDGNAPPNNWGATTDHIVSASDNQGGNIVGDREGSTCITDIVMALEAGQSGVFKFRRRIK